MSVLNATFGCDAGACPVKLRRVALCFDKKGTLGAKRSREKDVKEESRKRRKQIPRKDE